MLIRCLLVVLCVILLSNKIKSEDSDLEAVDNTEKETFSPEDLLGRIFSLANQVESRQQYNGFGLLVNNDGLNNYNNKPYIGLQPGTKLRRRRRKPKRQNYQLINQHYPPNQNNQLFNQNYQNGIQGNPQEQSDQGVLATLTDALGSIAKYDDYQCVPRLLCEATSGSESNALQESSFLPSFINMEPLLNLLSASSLMSSSPLFVFGRAALLGITSRGNSASCRYAYPSCPQDPERLVEYLNNHNGGFFRFFGGVRPQQSIPNYSETLAGSNAERLQQFYQLIAQNLQNQGILNAGNPQQFYQQLSQNLQNQAIQNVGNTKYGLYNNQDTGFVYGRPNRENIRPEKKRRRKPIKIGGNVVFPEYRETENGYIYDNSDFGNENEEQMNNIENRILNGPVKNGASNNYYFKGDIYSEDSYAEDAVPNFKFPEGSVPGPEVDGGKRKRGKSLKFPGEEPIEIDKLNYHSDKMFFPPDSSKLDSTQYGRPDVFKDDVKLEGDGDDFLYIVRGNGDPSKPEIVKIRGGRYKRLR